MPEMEPTDLCLTCQNNFACTIQIFTEDYRKETCDEYDPIPLEQLIECDERINAAVVGPCPVCGSSDTYDCQRNRLIEDGLVCHCLNCDSYWCKECRHVFDEIAKGVQCLHWKICDPCFEEHHYLSLGEFNEKICSTCGYSESCGELFDDTNDECWKTKLFLCPHEGNVSECANIQEFWLRWALGWVDS